MVNDHEDITAHQNDNSYLKNIAGQAPQPGAGDSTTAHQAELNALSNNSGHHNFGGFIGTSPVMLELYSHIEAAAKSQATVFITGESGTGKEVCAEAIHRCSPRADKPFIPINCAAIPRDLIESELFGHVKGAFTGAISNRDGAAALANGGTLFLDEIAEMSLDTQTKLLRFIQSRSYQKVGGGRLETTDVRILCATNRDPLEEVKQGHFREDLFYRLHVLPVFMPPLRERGDDVIDIALTFLRTFAQEESKNFTGLTDTSEKMLRDYYWPGNIRQLQNVMRNIVVLHNGYLVTENMLPPELLHPCNASHIETAHPLPATIPQDTTIKPLELVEHEAIQNAIKICQGNIPQAAAALGVSPSTLYRKKAQWEKNS